MLIVPIPEVKDGVSVVEDNKVIVVGEAFNIGVPAATTVTDVVVVAVVPAVFVTVSV